MRKYTVYGDLYLDEYWTEWWTEVELNDKQIGTLYKLMMYTGGEPDANA